MVTSKTFSWFLCKMLLGFNPFLTKTQLSANLNMHVKVASVSASTMFVSHTSKGGSGATNGPPATGLEPAAFQSPPQYKNGGEVEDTAGEWGRVTDREGERGSEQGRGGVPGPFLEPFCCGCCCCWHKVGEGETTREGGNG